jgi:hypothetical protein
MTPELAKDAHIVGDIVVASLAASVLRVIAQKAFIEPAAAWIGQTSLRRVWGALKDWMSRSSDNHDGNRF